MSLPETAAASTQDKTSTQSSQKDNHEEASEKKNKTPEAETCTHCGSRNPTNKCGRCGLERYCSAPCQRAHWPAHKPVCLAPEQRTLEAAQTAAPPRGPLAAEGDECAICLEPLSLGTDLALPCGHVFHPPCVEEVRKFGGAKQVCPLCRAVLPPGTEKLYEEILQRFLVISMRVQRGEASWDALTKTEQQEINEVHRLLM
jgi:ribosomal protein L40E